MMHVVFIIYSDLSGLKKSTSSKMTPGSVPKAYINYILFDENFRFVSGNFSRVGSNSVVKSHYNDVQMQNIQVSKNGYLYVYVSNESPVNVFFDNLKMVLFFGYEGLRYIRLTLSDDLTNGQLYYTDNIVNI